MDGTILTAISAELLSSRALEVCAQRLEAGEDTNLAVPLSARALVCAAVFAREPRPTLVVLAGEEAAARFAGELAAWLGRERVLRLPLRKDLPWLANEPEPELVGARVRALAALSSGERCVVVASVGALLRLVPESSAFNLSPLVISAGAKLPLGYDELARRLVELGYARREQATEPASFALRGDTLDLFLSTATHPVRLELFDNEVERIRSVLATTNQTLSSLDAIEIYPAREFALTAAAVARLAHAAEMAEGLDALPANVAHHLALLQEGQDFAGMERYLPYFYEKLVTPLEWLVRSTLVVLQEPRALFDDAAGYFDGLQASAAQQGGSTNGLFLAPGQLNFGAHQRLTMLSLLASTTRLDGRLEVKHPNGQVLEEQLALQAADLLGHGNLSFVAHANRHVREALMLALSDAGVPFDAVGCGAGADGTSGMGSLDAGAESRGDADSGSQNAGTAGSGTRVKNAGTAGSGTRVKNASSAGSGTRVKNASSADAGAESAGNTQAKVKRNTVHLIDLNLAQPLVLPAAKLAFLTLSENQQAASGRRAQRAGAARAAAAGRSLRQTTDPTSYTFPFKPGDYVVHATHGIALFKQVVRRESEGVERDYLYLEYSKGDKLYTPVENIDKLTRYVGVEGTSPRLTRLNTADWSRATGRARKAAQKMAFDLVDLYARRLEATGHAASPDTPQQYRMEQCFAYVETPDQLAAIADVKADMEAAKPMDRLICGDVGFGKTEVALRAAFKTVQDNMQVMLLCPTTILAQQHYTTFLERFEPFKVRVEVLSRFRSTAQQRQTLAAFARGEVDVLIGTHRLLSADVNPRALGLVIIDEEQRFGVQHKEKLVDLRAHIDVLTLSATPIPRTLQMALSGVRDMSLINTPPPARNPIEVHVGQWSEDLVSAAIRRELARGGQVYYVSNRVRSIDEARSRVIQAAPEARVEVAHGQMSERELEGVMERFSAGEIEVLVATTIIESGLDNPHTNTLIIEDSQRLGLAQLYQLKGRVGRSHNQAYAYFLFPSEQQLTQTAVDRLEAINEYQELGSGMRIAMRDLEIRGAGSLLGAEQHGNLAAVGFDLYASMLAEAVAATRRAGKASGEFALDAPAPIEAKIDLPLHAYLPEEYISATDERVLWYRRIAAATTPERLDEIAQQLEHAYGGLPAASVNLLDKARAKLYANELGVSSVGLARGKLELAGLKLTEQEKQRVKGQGGIYLVKSHKLSFPVAKGVAPLVTLLELLAALAPHEGGSNA